MTNALPGAAGDLAKEHPEIWSAYASLGKACAEAGPVTGRERRLVMLALAVGCGSEGAVHAHTRRAIAEGLERTALHQVALLGIGPLGLPSAIAAMTWIDDVIASPT